MKDMGAGGWAGPVGGLRWEKCFSDAHLTPPGAELGAGAPRARRCPFFKIWVPCRLFPFSL